MLYNKYLYKYLQHESKSENNNILFCEIIKGKIVKSYEYILLSPSHEEKKSLDIRINL